MTNNNMGNIRKVLSDVVGDNSELRAEVLRGIAKAEPGHTMSEEEIRGAYSAFAGMNKEEDRAALVAKAKENIAIKEQARANSIVGKKSTNNPGEQKGEDTYIELADNSLDKQNPTYKTLTTSPKEDNYINISNENTYEEVGPDRPNSVYARLPDPKPAPPSTPIPVPESLRNIPAAKLQEVYKLINGFKSTNVLENPRLENLIKNYLPASKKTQDLKNNSEKLGRS